MALREVIEWSLEHWAPVAAFFAVLVASVRMYVQVGLFAKHMDERNKIDKEREKREMRLEQRLDVFERMFEAHMARHDEWNKQLSRRISALEREGKL